MRKGGTGHLQYHERKLETFYLHEGKALVEFHDDNGSSTFVIMLPGQSYHVPIGAVHRVLALEDCVFFEASTPAFDDRVIVREEK